MKHFAYYALFAPDPSAHGVYCITFPDLPGAISEGENLSEARRMAKECMELHLSGMVIDGDEIPAPSSREELEKIVAVDPDVDEGWRLELIEIDLD